MKRGQWTALLCIALLLSCTSVGTTADGLVKTFDTGPFAAPGYTVQQVHNEWSPTQDVWLIG